jgi:hypothetical protein
MFKYFKVFAMQRRVGRERSSSAVEGRAGSSFVLGLALLGVGVLIGRQLFSRQVAAPTQLEPRISEPSPKRLAVVQQDEIRLPVEASPLSGDEALLAKVIEQVGGGHEAINYEWMPALAKAQYLAATVGADPPFATAIEAIYGMLSPSRASQVVGCMEDAVSRGRLPQDHLTRRLTRKSTLWDPIGKGYVEDAIRFSGMSNVSEAENAFTGGLEDDVLVGRDRKLFFANRALFPKGNTLNEFENAAVNEIFDRTDQPLRDLIRNGGIFEAYFEAVENEILQENYEALPGGVESHYLDKCRMDEGLERAIDIQVGVSGWSGCLIVYAGKYPELDRLREQVIRLRQERDSELEAYVSALR